MSGLSKCLYQLSSGSSGSSHHKGWQISQKIGLVVTCHHLSVYLAKIFHVDKFPDLQDEALHWPNGLSITFSHEELIVGLKFHHKKGSTLFGESNWLNSRRCSFRHITWCQLVIYNSVSNSKSVFINGYYDQSCWQSCREFNASSSNRFNGHIAELCKFCQKLSGQIF